MIAAWMIYSTVVAGLIGVAALALDRLVRPHGRPLRWIWAAALGLGFAAPILPRMVEGALGAIRTLVPSVPAPGSAGGGIPMAFLEPLVVQVGEAGLAAMVDPLLIAVWCVASAGLLASWARASLRIQRMTEEAEETEVRRAGSPPVVITGDAGPAVVGVLRTRILLPRWLTEGAREELEIALLHEEEHAAARDTALLAAAFAAVAVAPWNPALWWIRSRLREAVEVDCDRRVLAQQPGMIRTYADTLVRLSGKATRLSGATAMAEPPSLLERRIDAITSAAPRHPWIRGAAFSALAFFALVMACSAPDPGTDVTGPGGGAQAEAAPSSADDQEAAGPDGEAGTDRVEGVNGVSDLPDDALGDSPIIYVDGVRANPGDISIRGVRIFDGGGEGTELILDRDDIESIEVIRGGAAERIYGPEAADGVVEITTIGEAGASADPVVGDRPTFTPFTVAPNLVNSQEVVQALREEYPPLLRDAGIGGNVLVWFYIDDRGEVLQTILRESSGQEALDRAALRVAETMEFTPALNRDERVHVWISLPITFTTS